jgi:DNA-3-methyladenine glycosylase II
MDKPLYWEKARKHLAADPVLAPLLQQYKGGIIKSRGTALETLQRAVVGQQISVKAADSVWAKTIAAIKHPNDPAAWMAADDTTLRACGLSGQKAKYVKGIARAVHEGAIHPHAWAHKTDDDVRTELVKLPGIGVWTAEMFLMFHLLRPDVLPLGDVGLINGFKKAYGHLWKTDVDMKGWQGRITRHAAKYWAPYRSVATWYLWRSLDPIEVSY